MSIHRLIILAAGASSRMKQSEPVPELTQQQIDAANTLHKGMIPMGSNGERVFLDYLLYNASQAGVREVVFTVVPGDTSIADRYVGTPLSRDLGLTCFTVVQTIPEGRVKPLGSVDAVEQVFAAHPEWLSEGVMVCNGDNLYSIEVFKQLSNAKHPVALIAYDFAALGFAPERALKFAVLEVDPRTRILRQIKEKPSQVELDAIVTKTGRLEVSMNIFAFQPQIVLPFFQAMPINPALDEKALADACKYILEQRSIDIVTYPASDTIPDLTSKSDIPVVQSQLQAATFIFPIAETGLSVSFQNLTDNLGAF